MVWKRCLIGINRSKLRKVLITGAAGFIGFHTALKFIDEGYEVVGFDSINDYYDINLKYARLKELGIIRETIVYQKLIQSEKFERFRFIQSLLEEKQVLLNLFESEEFDYVVHLAAQAGVRYSITNPQAYIDSNITGFLNILEACRNYPIQHLVYASSSSVYGLNTEQPFSEEHRTDSPISLYAVTKKSNELMAHTYSHLFNINCTGLRFFTVYGPWGRPDMAIYLFTKAIYEGKPIKIFNNGDMSRDFTYVDDVVSGIFSVTKSLIEKSNSKFNLFNIGNSKPVKLLDFVEAIEKASGINAIKEFLPMQDGDVVETFANVSRLNLKINYCPKNEVFVGVKKFVNWYNFFSKSK